MTYTTSDNLKKLTEALAAYLREKLAKPTIPTALIEEIEETILITLENCIVACDRAAQLADSHEPVNHATTAADQPVISDSSFRACLRQQQLSRRDLPTLYTINDDQYQALLAHGARRGYSFYSSIEGAILRELEKMAQVYFKK